MDEFFNFLKTYELWVYVLLSIIAFIYIRRMIIAIMEWRHAIFGMEKEIARRSFFSALAIFFLLSMLAIVEFSLVTFVAPAYPQMVAKLATATLNPAASATITLSLTEISIEIDQITPTALEILTEGCVPGQIEWNYPNNGEEIRGKVELRGTINVANLGFYKYEYASIDNVNWITIAADNANDRIDSILGVWDTSQLIPGDYRLRLVIANNENQFMPACVVSVRILAP